MFVSTRLLKVANSRSLRLLEFAMRYDYTSNKFAFQHDRFKVKVEVTVFRKTLQLNACQASKGK